MIYIFWLQVKKITDFLQLFEWVIFWLPLELEKTLEMCPRHLFQCTVFENQHIFPVLHAFYGGHCTYILYMCKYNINIYLN
jgi:hypothetical protein